MSKNKHKMNQKGQVLLFVILTMTIALALGVGVSLETLTAISNIITSDTSQRALATAEGGAERVLSLDYVVLDAMADTSASAQDRCEAGGLTFVDNECRITFDPTDQDKFGSKASVTVEVFNYTKDDVYEFNVSQNTVKEVNLAGYGANGLEICWNGDADLYYVAYNETGETYKNIVLCDGDCNNWSLGSNTVQAYSANGYESCTAIASGNMPADPQGVRISTLGGNATVAVMPYNYDADLPDQGYKIVSTGSLLNESENVTRTVTTFKSFSYLPGVFDFAIYSLGEITGVEE